MDPQQIEQIGGYKVVQLIAEGGMSWIFEVIDPRFDVHRALKMLKPHAAAGKEFMRFEAEARVLARLDHPNVVTIYDFGRDESTQCFYYTMTLIDGSSLAQLGVLPIDRTCEIILDALAGLIEIHNAGIIHRDIKPGNILVDNRGRSLIADLGIARAEKGDQNITRVGTMVGTVLYSSPEQIRGQSVTKASDVFSMGLSLYKAITGETAYDSVDELDSTSSQEVMMYLGSLVHSGGELNLDFPKECPAQIRKVISRACSMRPEERYADARAMFAALSHAVREAEEARSALRLPLVLGVLALVLVAGAGYWWTRGDGESAPPEVQITQEPEIQAAEGAPPLEAAADLDEQTRAMLSRAEQLFARGKLASPKGANALESFQAVLAIDPDNQQASTGVQEIGRRYAERGAAAEAEGELDTALGHYRDGLLATPGDPALKSRIAALNQRIEIEGVQEAEQLAEERAGEEQRVQERLAEERARAEREERARLAEERAELDRREAERLAAERQRAAPPDMVAVEAGTFMRGKGSGSPASTAAFTIDRTEVTAAAYSECVAANACTPARRSRACNVGRADREDHPANCVDFNQAKAYCGWVGKRIPSGAEWEKAARGTEGQLYPWGDQRPSCDRAVLRLRGCPARGTAPVGSKLAGVSPYGARDMVGNVWEWTEEPGQRNPVLRGSAWNVAPVAIDHLYPYPAKKGTPSTGIRCVR